MRVALAAVLFARPDVLLLDEPTNYLDLEGAIWLETFLARYPHTVLVISHDRDLLNRSVDAILHLDRQKLTLYQGPYDTFEDTRRARLEQLVSEKRKQDAARAHMQSFVDRFRAKASKARQAQSRIKALERMKPIAAIVEDQVAGVQLPHARRSCRRRSSGSRTSASATAAGRSCAHLDLRIDQDDRIALLGQNGQGKSTLAKLLSDRLAPMSGRKLASSKLRVGYFAQHQVDELELDETPLQHLAAAAARGAAGQAARPARGGRHRRGHRHDRGRAALGRPEVAAGAAPRRARRAAHDHPRRADQPSRHREPRRAGRGADRVRRRGDPRQPRPAPRRARRRAAVAGQGRPGHARSRTTWTPTGGCCSPSGAGRRRDQARARGEAEAARRRRAARWRRSAPRSRSARRGWRSSRRCATEIDGRLANPLLYARGDTEAVARLQKKRAEVEDGLARAEALWLAALERLEAAGAADARRARPGLRDALRHHRPDRARAALHRADPRHDGRGARRASGGGRSSSPSCILAAFGLFGERLLTAIGISIPAFRISGGLLLFLTALDMLFERRSDRRERKADEAAGPTRRSSRWRCR